MRIFMLESNFKAGINQRLRGFGCLVLCVHGHGGQAPGWPDTQVYSLQWSGHIEYKRNMNPCSAIQKKIIKELRARGTGAWVLRWWEGRVRIEDQEGAVYCIKEWNVTAGDLLSELAALTKELPANAGS